ncbi:MAG: hypothetical protein RLZZ502_1333, partial [Pseudomonadota bacterium]
LKPDVANQIADKFIEKDKVALVTGVTFSNIMLAVHKKITDANIFLIGSTAGPAPIAGASCSPYQFITSWQNDMQAEVVGEYARLRGFKRVVALASNYQAGKDFIAGFKRNFKDPLLAEIYTPLAQMDYSAELAQIEAQKPDALYFFYPGAVGVSFIKQLAQSSLAGKVTILSSSSIDATTLRGMGEMAMGAYAGTFWAQDFRNEVSRKFVADFEAKYGRIPSQFAAQSYDAALLIDSALKKAAGRVDDKKALQAALKAADFASVRGKLVFGSNHFPVQDMYILQVDKDNKGRVNLKTVGNILPAHADFYAKECKMRAL